MISWIQKYLQHHFRTVFAVLLAVVIISFVFTIGAAPGIGRADRQMVDRQFFGYNLSLQSDSQQISREAELSFSLNPRYEYGDLQNYALHRVATLWLADQWHIPSTTKAELEDAIKKVRMFTGQDGQFDAKAYQTFRDNLKAKGSGVTEADIVRVISDDVRADKVQALLSGPGYVLPSDVKNLLIRADTEWTLATATTDYNAYKLDLKPSEADLTQSFESAGGRYDIPPQVSVSALDFSALDYMGSVTVTEPEVRAFYNENPSRFPKPETKPNPATPSVTPPANPDADFAAVRGQVESELKLERARKLAAKAASDVSLALYEAKATTAEAVESFAAARKLKLKTIPPFTQDAVPAELSGSRDVGAEAFRLNKGRVVSDVLPTNLGNVILVWKATLPSRKPAFAEVRDKVSADYIESERRKRFIEQGKTAKAKLEERLKAGDAFDKAVAAASESSGLKFEAKTLAPFTPRNRPQDLDYSILGTLERLDKGQVSDMVSNADKGIFVYAADKKAPDTSEANPKFAEMRSQMAASMSRASGSAYIADLVDKELEKSKPKAQ